MSSSNIYSTDINWELNKSSLLLVGPNHGNEVERMEMRLNHHWFQCTNGVNVTAQFSLVLFLIV